MERLLMNELIAWKNRTGRKPLLLRGARQTGKTWLLEEFGRREFTDMVKVDFMLDAQARSIFERDLDPHRIISQIELRYGKRVVPGETLLFFDEIQEAPRGITALKYFCEQAPEYFVATGGSYMGVALRREEESYPVGKVDLLTLRPLCFEEFLRAVAGAPLADAVASADLDSLTQVQDVITEHLKDYLVVGGMPEVVAAFAKSRDYFEARRLQSLLVSDYDADFSKHAPARLLERMRLVWKSLPTHLSRENKKFIYGAVRPGARARDFEESIQWLSDYGAVHKVCRASALRLPLSSYQNESIFKLFCLDVGLLCALSGLEPSVVLDGSLLFTEFKGALTEQYVAQELLAQGHDPAYWSSDTGRAEVDFAVQSKSIVLPIEVKAGENLQSKSLRVACEKFALDRAVRTSLSKYRDEGWLINIPLWAIGCLDNLAAKRQ